MQFSSKLPKVGTTIFTTMSALAKEHQAINLSQGFPDFSCSQELISLANHYIKNNFNQYAPMPGAIELRERIAEIIQTCYNSIYHPDSEITITAGATQAIYTTIAAFIKSNDEVIVFEPTYDCYAPAIEINGGIVVYSQLNNADFSINWDDVKNKINERTKAIIINSPHNPSGTIITKNDIQNQIRASIKPQQIHHLAEAFDGTAILCNSPPLSSFKFCSMEFCNPKTS